MVDPAVPSSTKDVLAPTGAQGVKMSVRACVRPSGTFLKKTLKMSFRELKQASKQVSKQASKQASKQVSKQARKQAGKHPGQQAH